MALLALSCGLSSWKSWAMVAQASASSGSTMGRQKEGRKGPRRCACLMCAQGPVRPVCQNVVARVRRNPTVRTRPRWPHPSPCKSDGPLAAVQCTARRSRADGAVDCCGRRAERPRMCSVRDRVRCSESCHFLRAATYRGGWCSWPFTTAAQSPSLAALPEYAVLPDLPHATAPPPPRPASLLLKHPP